jgi:xylan 1,4-beta-xylosidase
VALLALGSANAQTITVDASTSPRGNPHFWSECVGTGTASLTLRSDLQTHYKIGNRELGMKRVRGHGVLNDDMGIYKGPGNYDWTNFDTYLDAIVGANMRPLMELSFMPSALARNGDSRDPAGNLDDYSSFIQAVVQHAVDRFGADDVAQWYWEVWNEFNYSGFWNGTEDDYLQMYDAAAAGATAALPNILIGGPATTSGSTSQMTNFLNHVAQTGSRVTFLSSHAYAGGGSDGPTAIATFARNDNNGRVDVIDQAGVSGTVKSFNTEWNSSYSGQGGNMAQNTISMDSHANAPFILKTVKLLADQVEGDSPPLDVFSYWVISDVFDESSGPSGSYILGHDGVPFGQVFGLMNFQGLRKAAFNGFKMLNYLGSKQLSVSGGSGDSDGVDGIASISESGDEVAVIVYNYYATLLTSGSDSVTVNVDNLPFAGEDMFVTKFVVDENHSNPYGVWVSQGSPTNPTEEQWEEMRAAQHLALAEPVTTMTADASYSTTLDMPRQGAALILLSKSRPVTGRNALVEMEGEDYDGQSGATKEDSEDEGLGQSITLDGGGYIFYDDVDFSDAGVDTLALRVAAQGDTTLELHADSDAGTLVGTCAVSATGGAWETQMCDLSATTGVHTLYVMAGGSLRLNWMKFGGGGVVVDPGGGAGGSAGAGPVGSGGAVDTGVGGGVPSGGAAAVPTTTPSAAGGTPATGAGGASVVPTPGAGGGAVPAGNPQPGATSGPSPAAPSGEPAAQTCQPPLQQCGTACVDTTSDVANCGVCGTACTSPDVCSAGSCSSTCAQGLIQCGQSCVDLMSSLVSCGACDMPCAAGQTCEAGVCTGGVQDQPAAADDGGCGCRIGARRDSGRGWLLALFGLGLFLGRRRRSGLHPEPSN